MSAPPSVCYRLCLLSLPDSALTLIFLAARIHGGKTFALAHCPFPQPRCGETRTACFFASKTRASPGRLGYA